MSACARRRRRRRGIATVAARAVALTAALAAALTAGSPPGHRRSGDKEKLVETRTVSHDICLPSSLSMIDVSAIEATTENGVLRVVVPKMLGSVKIPVRDRKLLTLASGSRGLSLTESGMRKRQLDKGDPSASGASPSPMVVGGAAAAAGALVGAALTWYLSCSRAEEPSCYIY